jgi:hypothetical protein
MDMAMKKFQLARTIFTITSISHTLGTAPGKPIFIKRDIFEDITDVINCEKLHINVMV